MKKLLGIFLGILFFSGGFIMACFGLVSLLMGDWVVALFELFIGGGFMYYYRPSTWGETLITKL